MSDIVYAKAKYVRTTPQKVRLVVNLVRGKKALEAVDILKFLNKAAAKDVLKVLNSAIANATFNNEMDKNDLVITEAYANEAPTYKRGMAVSRGRYHKILKRNSHIVIGLSTNMEEDNVEKKKSDSDKKAKKVKKTKNTKKEKSVKKSKKAEKIVKKDKKKAAKKTTAKKDKEKKKSKSISKNKKK